MKIRDLRIDGFGQFADREFGPFEQPVTVFYGPNEAGKSTLLEFIRSILFGFLDGRSRRNLYPPLSGGRQSGSVSIVSDAGEFVTVRRLQGTGGGRVYLTTSAGEAIPTAELPRLLGNHSRTAFENIFAFTIDELHDAALLSDESVNSQIYSAGMGATRLPDALRTLERQKRDLFLSGGSRHAIYTAAGALDEVDTALREIANNATEYGREAARLEVIERELDDLRARRLRLESERQRYENLDRAWNDWLNLVTAQKRLGKLPDIENFPANGVSRLETLDAQADDARKETESAVARVKSGEEAASLLIEHESILEQSGAIRDLAHRRTAFDQSVKDVPERQAELGAMRASLNDTLSDLGPDWDAERLTKFDLSIVVREEVSAYGGRLRDAREEVSRSRSALAAAETALEEASQATERAQRNLESAPEPAFDNAGLSEHRSRLRRVRDTLDAYVRAVARVEDFQAQLGYEPDHDESPAVSNSGRMLAAALGVLGIGMIALGTLLGDSATIIGVGAGFALVAVAVYLFVRSGSATRPTESPIFSRIRRQAAEEDQRLTNLRNELEQESADLEINALDVNSLNDAEESLDYERGRLAERDRLSNALRDASELLHQRTSGRDASASAVDSAEGALDAAESDWKQWLEERGLRQEFSPDNIEVLSRLVDLGRTRHAEVTAMERRITAIYTDIKEFLDILQPLTMAHGFELDRDDYPSTAVVADELIDLHTQVLDKSRVKRTAEADLQAARDELAERERRLQETTDKIDALISAGGAQDSEDFLRRAEVYAEHQKLTRTIDDALDRLQRISGPGTGLERLRAALDMADRQTIADDIRRTEDELNEIDNRIESLATDRGTIQNSLGRLRGEEDSSRLRAERHRLLEEMRHHAREWTVLTLAENLLREAQAKFERERQPDVIRHSEKFFRDITGGRYQTVFSPLGTSEIHVADSARAPKQPAQLSRGTREQLFLSLRFGLIRDLGQRAERLPVIVDEVMVNFDPQRALRAANAFIELSQSNQVLVFTCHPWIVDLFQRASRESGATEPGVVKFQ